MAAKRYEISDEQWEQIKDMFPRASTGRPPKDNRLIFNAILWLARSGAAWADIPERYGPYQTVYSRFCKWRDDGTLLHIFQILNEDADFEGLILKLCKRNNPQNYANTKITTKQGNAEERPDAGCKIYGESSGRKVAAFLLTGIFQADKPRELEGRALVSR